MLANLRQDLVFSVRSLRRSPGLAVACIVTIALGVGANGVMFSLADRPFARPPAGVANPAALRRLYARTTWTVGEVPEIRSGFPFRVFSLLDSSLAPRVRLAGYTTPDTMPMIVGNSPMTVHGAYVTRDYMAVLGVGPAIGRFFSADEEMMGRPVTVAVISDRLWCRVFGGEYAMIGVYLPSGERAPYLDKRSVAWNATTPTYLAATGSRLVRGRFFADADRNGTPVIVVNETAARFYWPQRDAIGQCLRLFSSTAPCSTVIGIVRDSHVSDVVERPVVQLITPFGYDSTGRPRGASTVIVRAKPGQNAAVERLVRDELTRVFEQSAVPYVESARTHMQPELRPWRVGLLLFGGFGVLALVVAALGTYSLLSYAVTQRLHEIGVRIALGARGADVQRLIVGQGVGLALGGVTLGLIVSLAASRVMQSLLYDTSPREPIVASAVGLLLVAIAAAASALPARRAARVDPVGVLRAE